MATIVGAGSLDWTKQEMTLTQCTCAFSIQPLVVCPHLILSDPSRSLAGSITNIDDDAQYKCKDGSSPEIRNKVISGVVGAASSVTSIQVANLLRLFKIPQVSKFIELRMCEFQNYRAPV